ncbi:MAG: hypothetical protein AAFU70_11265 [Planctomycetota bacterium]
MNMHEGVETWDSECSCGTHPGYDQIWLRIDEPEPVEPRPIANAKG